MQFFLRAQLVLTAGLVTLAGCIAGEIDAGSGAALVDASPATDAEIGELKAPCWSLPIPPPGCVRPPPPPPPDDDGDGIADSYENELLYRFAPKIWLDANENRWPVTVDWLLTRSTLRYSHARCNDHQILAMGSVNAINLIQQSHRDANDPATSLPWNACQHSGASRSSASHQGSTKNTFFLQYTTAAHNGLSYANRARWEIYGHVAPTSAGNIEIQYWQLYAFNDSAASSNHEGDWEYTSVVIDDDEDVQEVIFFRHGYARSSAPGSVEWSGKHHVTYVAKGGHAQYRSHYGFEDIITHCNGDAGAADQAQASLGDWCSRGYAWNTWLPEFGRIVNVGEKAKPLNGATWLRYSGLWGEIGAAADAISFTSGPRGPAYQATWEN